MIYSYDLRAEMMDILLRVVSYDIHTSYTDSNNAGIHLISYELTSYPKSYKTNTSLSLAIWPIIDRINLIGLYADKIRVLLEFVSLPNEDLAIQSMQLLSVYAGCLIDVYLIPCIHS